MVGKLRVYIDTVELGFLSVHVFVTFFLFHHLHSFAGVRSYSHPVFSVSVGIACHSSAATNCTDYFSLEGKTKRTQ